ncbi:PAS domain S-box protein [Actinoplanes siamensis]|uniref:PAS domain S-box protein n=1 Tax=Actinoplanes siamensis TaxID=1223317 RepID=UPI0019430222|nr:PAS domain S-box protein [Actinoplanes siamensis]
MRVPEGVALDVSERMELERLRRAIAHAPDGFVGIDEAGLVTTWNAAATRLLGWAPDEIVGRPLGEVLIPEELRAAHRAGMLRYLDGGAPAVLGRPVDLPALHRDGHRVVVEITIWPSGAPEDRNFHAFLRDTAPRRAAAEQSARQTRALLAAVETQRAVTAVAQDRDQVLRVVTERAVAVFPAACGAMIELIEGDLLRYVAGAGTLAAHVGKHQTIADSVSGAALTEGRATHCTDVETDDRASRGICRATGVRSMCVSPLYHGDRAIGVLKIASNRPHAFDADDAYHLDLVAGTVGAALRHAEDYEANVALLAERTGNLAALEAIQTRFRYTFESSPLGLSLCSLDERTFGRFLEANSAMTEITGYTAEDLAGMSFQDLQHPDEVATAEDALRRLAAGDAETMQVERRCLRKDGKHMSVVVRVARVRDTVGAEQPYVVVQVEDVTGSRVADAAMQRQARLLELIPAAVIVRDLSGGILWWNTGAERLYGWSADAALSRITHRLLNTTILGGATLAEQDEALRRHGHWDGEMQHLTAAGRTVTVLSRQVVHRPADGGVQVLEINTDVSAARAAQQAVALNEQRFRAQFTQSTVGQVVCGLDGTLIAVNKAFAGMLGRRAEEVAGTTVEELIHPDDRPVAHRNLARLFTGEADGYAHEVRLRHADGHWVDAEATISVVRGPGGRPKHLIVVATDISARRAAERARDQAAAALSERNLELEAADQLKLDMIGMLGHEIGNPLSSILGYSDLLADEMDPEHPHAGLIKIINRQAERLDEIVREVLAMVTLDAGNINAVRSTLSLRAEVARALEGTDNRHIPILGPDADVLFHVSHLQQVVVNLLSNAAKYAGGAGALRIEPAGDRVHLRVEDSGPGVPPEFRPRLFERLARADDTAGTVRGTGLGLYIVRNLARANAGDVRYEPNPGGGSVFILEADSAPPAQHP